MDSKLLLLLLVIAVVTATANGKYSDKQITKIVKDRIMQNQYFHCYPLIQPTFKQYAMLILLPEPQLTYWQLFPNPIREFVYPSYERASAPSNPINYLVARSWWSDDYTVEHAESELMNRIKELQENWKHEFKTSKSNTILLYTRKSPCEGCAEAIKEQRSNYPNKQFIVAYSYLLNIPNAYNILQDLATSADITVVQVYEIKHMREKCIDVLKNAKVCYNHLLKRKKPYNPHRS